MGNDFATVCCVDQSEQVHVFAELYIYGAFPSLRDPMLPPLDSFPLPLPSKIPDTLAQPAQHSVSSTNHEEQSSQHETGASNKPSMRDEKRIKDRQAHPKEKLGNRVSKTGRNSKRKHTAPTLGSCECIIDLSQTDSSSKRTKKD